MMRGGAGGGLVDGLAEAGEQQPQQLGARRLVRRRTGRGPREPHAARPDVLAAVQGRQLLGTLLVQAKM